MRTKWTKKKLDEFTQEIASLYEQGKIKAPIHLSGGSEEKLIRIFKRYYKEGSWVFSTHRSQYHWLLSGRNKEELVAQILEGHSMHVFGEKFFTSAIVAGNISIAVGVALALKLKKSKQIVFCFVGDMSYECGIAHESIKFAQGYDLPILFIVEDNGYSVETPTKSVWKNIINKQSKVIRFNYIREFPHAGVGKFVLF